MISSPFFLALEKKKKLFFPKLRFPLNSGSETNVGGEEVRVRLQLCETSLVPSLIYAQDGWANEDIFPQPRHHLLSILGELLELNDSVVE